MSLKDYYIDASTRHQVFLQRYGGGESKKAIATLNRLRRDINARLMQEPTQFQAARLYAVLEDIEKLAADAFGVMISRIQAEVPKLAANEAEFSAVLYGKGAVIDFSIPSEQSLLQAVSLAALPAVKGYSSITIDEALRQFSTKKARQISQLIRDRLVLGDTTPDIAKAVGQIMTGLQQRQLDALVRTIVNHVSSVARYQVYEENADIMDGYQWVATLDNKTTIICGTRDGEVYKLGAGPMPPAHYNCVLGDTLITSAKGVSAVFKRIFKGEVITINTISGNKLTVTPNHPILTSEGWKSAKVLNVGDKCINQTMCKGVGSVDIDNDRCFETAEDIFESFGRSCGVSASEMEVSTPDFHGDGIDNEIAEVRATSDLSPVFDVGIIEKCSKGVFNFRNVPFVNSALHRFRKFAFFVKASGATSSGDVGFFSKALSFFRACSIHSGLLLRGSAPQGDPVFSEDSLYGTWADTESISDSPDTYAGGVFFDDIVNIDVSDFSGHVYNLQTLDHCYSANGIITHNCRSTTVPVVNPKFSKAAGMKGERPAMGAKGARRVSGRTTYSGWLKRQPVEFVDEALGVERSRLFRSGKLKLDKFVDPTGRVYTLDQLARMNPFAFQEE